MTPCRMPTALELCLLRQKQQSEQALAEAERAIALDPNYADSYAGTGGGAELCGAAGGSIGSVEKAIRLNPRYPSLVLIPIRLVPTS